MSERDTSKVECGICENVYSSVGMATHLKHAHGLTVEEYVKSHSEFRKKKLREQEREDELQCEVCGDWMHSERALAFHVKDHGYEDKEEYVVQELYDGERPTCGCGCGELVSFTHTEPYFADYVTGHNSKGESNPMYGRSHDAETRAKMSEAAIARGTPQDRNTEPEKAFKRKFGDVAEFQKPTEAGAVDFFFPERGWFVEVDGEFWHPDDKTELNSMQLRGVINDHRKDRELSPLYRIRPDDIGELSSPEDIPAASYEPDYSWGFGDAVVSEEYIRHLWSESGREKARGLADAFTTFLTEVVSELPKPEPRYDLEEIVMRLRNYDMSRLRNGDAFRNNVWSLGNSFLKSRFDSFWDASYTGNKSPKETFRDRDALKAIVRDRTGFNDRDEVFNLSKRTLLQGMSAHRRTVSFMKPLVAASALDRFLGDARGPKVLDPCAGFGARMLAFSALYPRGVYVGVERNPETAAELRELGEELPAETVVINDRFQDAELPQDHDLAFTSPPYPDTETYSDGNALRDWDRFLEELTEIDRLVAKVRKDMVGGTRETWPLVKGGGYMSEASEEVIAQLT